MRSLIIASCGVLAAAADVCEDTVLLQVKTRKDPMMGATGMAAGGPPPPMTPPMNGAGPPPNVGDVLSSAVGALIPDVLPPSVAQGPPAGVVMPPPGTTIDDLENPTFVAGAVTEWVQGEVAAGTMSPEDAAGVDVDAIAGLIAAEVTGAVNEASEPFMPPPPPQESHCHQMAKHCEWGPDGMDETMGRFHRNSFKACRAEEKCWEEGGVDCWQMWEKGFGLSPCAAGVHDIDAGMEGPLPAYETVADFEDNGCLAEKKALKELGGIESPGWDCEAFSMIEGGWLAVDTLACKFYEGCNNPEYSFWCELYDGCMPGMSFPEYPLDFECAMFGECGGDEEFGSYEEDWDMGYETEGDMGYEGYEDDWSTGYEEDFSTGYEEDFDTGYEEDSWDMGYEEEGTGYEGDFDFSDPTLVLVKSLSNMKNAANAAKILKSAISPRNLAAAQKAFIAAKARHYIK